MAKLLGAPPLSVSVRAWLLNAITAISAPLMIIAAGAAAIIGDDLFECGVWRHSPRVTMK